MIIIKKLGVALSSGGARGFAHIGVLKVLEKNNIPISYITGTSMGAVIAAFYALYGEVRTVEKIALGFRKRDTIKLVDLNNPKYSLIKGKKLKSFLKKYFGNKTFRDTKIPLKVGATALEDGSQVVFSRGKILDALLASGAFPGVFPPVKYRGKHLVDGGLSDATPVNLVKKMGADVILAVDLFTLRKIKQQNFTMMDVLERTYEILVSNLSKYSEKEYGKNIIVLRPKAGHRIETFHFHRAKKYIEAGEKEALKYLKKIKKILD